MQMKSLRVGNTPLRRAQKLEKRLGIRRLHLKLEGENPSGTHKDRAALMHALDARKRGQNALTAVSCGNYGAALAYIARSSTWIVTSTSPHHSPHREERR